MIRVFIPFCLFLLTVTSQAQVCELPNGDLEEWVDFTAEIQDLATETLPAETVLTPDGYISSIRFVNILFAVIFGEIGFDELPNIIPNILGSQRSTDASSGEFAVRLQADQVFPLADLITANACNGTLPTSFSLDVKHVGDVADTLTIIGTFGEFSGLPETEEEIADYSAFFAEEIIVSSASDYENLTFPILETGSAVSADSFTLVLLLSSNENSLSMGDTSYFLIDNMKFQGEGNSTSIKTLTLSSPVDIYPTTFQQIITIDNNNAPLEATIYSMSGQRKDTFLVPNGISQHDLSFISNRGSYLIKLFDTETQRSTTKILIKQ